MTICSECKDKSCLKTGKPCEDVEALLRAEGIYGARYIRPRVSSSERRRGYGKWREIPFSSLGRDKDGEEPQEDDVNP